MPTYAIPTVHVYTRISVSPNNIKELANIYDVSEKTIRQALRYEKEAKSGFGERYRDIQDTALKDYYGVKIEDTKVVWQEKKKPRL